MHLSRSCFTSSPDPVGKCCSVQLIYLHTKQNLNSLKSKLQETDVYNLLAHTEKSNLKMIHHNADKKEELSNGVQK